MANLLVENQKKATSLKSSEDRINSELMKLQDELRYISDAVNKKVVERETIQAERKRLQEETSAMVLSGKWIEKEEVVTPTLSTSGNILGTPATSSSVILIPSLDRNPVWNFVKNIFKKAWEFFSNLPKQSKASNPAVSTQVSSTKAN